MSALHSLDVYIPGAEPLTDAERNRDAVSHLALQPREPFGWASLGMINSSRCRRDAASMYSRLGLHPIRLHGMRDGVCTCGRCEPDSNSRGKHPVAKGWQGAALDRAQLDRELTQHWRSNLGLRMGLQPDSTRLVCIDVDGPLSLLEPLEAKAGKLPRTLTATSGKGFHLFYRLSAGADAPKNLVKLSPGVDVRSEGGQVVAAPSDHYSGRQYNWHTCCEPAVLP